MRAFLRGKSSAGHVQTKPAHLGWCHHLGKRPTSPARVRTLSIDSAPSSTHQLSIKQSTSKNICVKRKILTNRSHICLQNFPNVGQFVWILFVDWHEGLYRPWNYFRSILTCVKIIPQRRRRTDRQTIYCGINRTLQCIYRVVKILSLGDRNVIGKSQIADAYMEAVLWQWNRTMPL